ncbi:hypothetical protein CF319_g7601 [Tilletia indica]|nr:hypothetical protein CF319_g7601 [Tilletia indica]
MVRCCLLITLLPFVFCTFALPLEGTAPGRSPTALQPDSAVPQSTGRDVRSALPGRLGAEREGSSDSTSPTYPSAKAAETARLMTRGDPPINEAMKWYEEAARLSESPDVDYAKVVDALRNGKEAVKKAVEKAMSSVDKKKEVAKPIQVLYGKPLPFAEPVEVLHGKPVPFAQPVEFQYSKPVPFAQSIQVLHGEPVWPKGEPGSSSGTTAPWP